MGVEPNTCCGIKRNKWSCNNPLTGASYCQHHRDQECKDVEMPDVVENYCQQSEDVEMGGM